MVTSSGVYSHLTPTLANSILLVLKTSRGNQLGIIDETPGSLSQQPWEQSQGGALLHTGQENSACLPFSGPVHGVPLTSSGGFDSHVQKALLPLLHLTSASQEWPGKNPSRVSSAGRDPAGPRTFCLPAIHLPGGPQGWRWEDKAGMKLLCNATPCST